MAEGMTNGSWQEQKTALVVEELKKHKLFHDAVNSLGLLAALPTEINIEEVMPLEHYEEYLLRQEEKFPGQYELVMSLSDPAAVAAFNALIDEFNADLTRIKREKDYATCENFVRKLVKLIREEY
jgi:hypothetical protein